MLIPFSKLIEFIKTPITGVIHIGAHNCEEHDTYTSNGITRVIWLDALRDKVEAARSRGLTAYHAVVSDKDDETVTFNKTNNGQSSSILSLGTHRQHHPDIYVVSTSTEKTTRFDTLCKREGIQVDGCNFLSLDIQGAELKALNGFGDLLRNIDYIYTEVNSEELYVGGALVSQIDSFLSTFGFVRVLTEMTNYKWGDAFYVKRAKKETETHTRKKKSMSTAETVLLTLMIVFVVVAIVLTAMCIFKKVKASK
jgi:FkbM family methyltransferase